MIYDFVLLVVISHRREKDVHPFPGVLETSHSYLPSYAPGYKDTARMCVEAALALVDLPKAQKPGGVYSPAAACAEGLFERLLATGTTWEVCEL